ncbi:DUF4383 domain-containing protein [Mycolicibacterium poriferae]|uniref:DUF4383 domain-containing protein n=1 Tax=Mycolicibacterium poriferae TaxID=39694 RepID=UPI00321BBB2B
MASQPKYMAVQGAALIVAAALTLIGLLGFIPGATANVGELAWAGQHSGATLFGVFVVSVLVNAFHLVLGGLGFAMAPSYSGARAYLLLGGVLYLGLWLYGLLVERGSDAHVVPLNGADNWLHLGIGAVMLLLTLEFRVSYC